MIAVPTTAVVNIPLLIFAVPAFIVVIFALVMDPNPIVAVSVILIAAVESDFKFKNLLPFASVPALDTEN